MQRLTNLNEALTRHHLAIDAVELADDDAGARTARRELTRQVEALCLRADAFAIAD